MLASAVAAGGGAPVVAGDVLFAAVAVGASDGQPGAFERRVAIV